MTQCPPLRSDVPPAIAARARQLWDDLGTMKAMLVREVAVLKNPDVTDEEIARADVMIPRVRTIIDAFESKFTEIINEYRAT